MDIESKQNQAQRQNPQLKANQRKQAEILRNKLVQTDNNYQKLRRFIVRGILQLKDELLPLLYYFYLKYYRESITEPVYKDFLIRWKSDFESIPSYSKELNYLEGLIHQITEEQISKDSFLQQIFDQQKTIFVSQFTYETLMLFLKRQEMEEFYYDLVGEQKIYLRIVTDPETESLRMPNSVKTTEKFDDVQKMNQDPLRIAPHKDDLQFSTKLENFYQLKKRNEINLGNKKAKDKLAADADISEYDYFDKVDYPQPEIKFKNKLRFAQAYLDKSALEEGQEPNVLNVSIRDPNETITCCDIERTGNILVIGFANAKIVVYVLNPQFEEVHQLEKAKQKYVDSIKQSIQKTIDGDGAIQPEKEKDGKKEKEKDKEKDKAGLGNLLESTPKDKYELLEFSGHEGAISSISLNYDDLYFLSSSLDTTIRLWCIRSRTCIGIYRGHINTIWKVKFSPKGYYFASGSSDTTARLWSTDKQYALRIFTGHSADVNCLEFSENGNYLVTGSYDKTIRVWEVKTAKCARIRFQNNEVVSAMSISNNGKYLLTGSDDGYLILWNLHTDERKNSFIMDRTKRINSISFSVDNLFVCISNKSKVCYYEIERLLNENGDGYDGLRKTETQSDIIKKQDDLATNAIFSSDTPEFDFLQTKFSNGNFIFCVSRSFN